jgi:hypothetical protein
MNHYEAADHRARSKFQSLSFHLHPRRTSPLVSLSCVTTHSINNYGKKDEKAISMLKSGARGPKAWASMRKTL